MFRLVICNRNSSRVPSPSAVAVSPTSHGPDALSKKATQEAAPIIKVFGVYTVCPTQDINYHKATNFQSNKIS